MTHNVYDKIKLRPTDNRLHRVLHQSKIDETQYQDWSPGNVELDLRNLRQAVKKSRARNDLAQQDRLDLLDEFALQRRELYPDVKRYILRPILLIAFTTCARMLYFVNISSSSWVQCNGVITACFNRAIEATDWLYKLCISLANLHFWSLTIIAPIILLLFSMMSQRMREKLVSHQNDEEEVNTWGKLLGLEDTKHGNTSSQYSDASLDECSDYSVHLLVNWVFSVFPAGIIGCVMASCSLLQHFQISPWDRRMSSRIFGHKMIACMFQSLTRLGAVASLHQYPMLNWQLKKANFKKNMPTDFIPTALHKILSHGLMRLFPWMVALDISQCISLGLSTVINRHNVPRRIPSSIASTNNIIDIAVLSMRLLTFLSALISLTNIVALKKLIRIQHFTNISLSKSNDDTTRLMQKESNESMGNESTYKWRYKLCWREPRRLSTSLRNLWRDFVIFFFSGWEGTDYVHGDGYTETDSDGNLIISAKKEHEELPKILQLVGEDMEKNPHGFRDRSTWVAESLSQMASIHESNYKQKKYDDPLGIAVYRTLGVGISFDYDHDSKLDDGEAPSIHRLRARAAKSIVKYCNHSPTPISEEEKQRFVNELITLVPIDAPPPDGKDLTIETLRNSDAETLPRSIQTFMDTEESSESLGIDDPYLKADEDCNENEKEHFA